jgi:hypothetical protein
MITCYMPFLVLCLELTVVLIAGNLPFFNSHIVLELCRNQNKEIGR